MSTQAQSADTTVPIAQAKDRYENVREFKSDSTRAVYLTGVRHFIKWCEDESYTTTADLKKWNVGTFRQYIDDLNVKTYSKSTYVFGVRDFLKFLESQGALPDTDTHEAIDTVHVDMRDKRRDAEIEQERLDGILAHMREYYPRHRDTIIMRILAARGLRTCELRAVDVGDVKVTGDGYVISLHCRPGTPLKRGREVPEHRNHERNVPIDEALFEAIQDYCEAHRHDVTDHCGGDLCGSDERGCAGTCDRSDRLPLITSRNGRLSKKAIGSAVRKWTCPAHTGVGECMHDEKPPADKAGECEPSRSPHVLRKRAITRLRNQGAHLEDIGELVGADPEILREHYDFGDRAERAARARRALAADD